MFNNILTAKSIATMGIAASATFATIMTGFVNTDEDILSRLPEPVIEQTTYNMPHSVDARVGAVIDNSGSIDVSVAEDMEEAVVTVTSYANEAKDVIDTVADSEIVNDVVDNIPEAVDVLTENTDDIQAVIENTTEALVDNVDDGYELVNGLINGTIPMAEQHKIESNAKDDTVAQLIENSGDYSSETETYVEVDNSFINGIIEYNNTHEDEGISMSSEIASMQSQYPSGSYWGPDTYYKWRAGTVYRGGYGCAGFAYMLSDAIYGDAPAEKIYGNGDVRVNDCIELFDNAHTAFVLSVNGDGTVTVAEGNINGGYVAWGTRYNISDISAVLRR